MNCLRITFALVYVLFLVACVVFLWKLPDVHETKPRMHHNYNTKNFTFELIKSIQDNLPIQAPKINNEQSEPKKSVPKSVNLTIKRLFDEGIKDRSRLMELLIRENPLEIPSNISEFKCPTRTSEYLSLPDIINHTRTQDFINNNPDSWIFYQHLRKAGGTGFCDLAQKNLQRKQIPPYFCMIDHKGSLATPPWNSPDFLLPKMRNKGFKITANEWDVYTSDMGNYTGAVLATTFRHPVDRWYSQYRFEHLEHRDGSKPNAPRRDFRTWYNNNKFWFMGTNYYVNTFVGTKGEIPKNTGHFYWSYMRFKNIPMKWSTFQQALENVRKFHIVLIMEWLDTSAPMLKKVLNWKSPPRQVLPHEVQAKRSQVVKKTPVKKLVKEEDYNEILKENIFDFLLYQCAQRLYLEKLNCEVQIQELS